MNKYAPFILVIILVLGSVFGLYLLIRAQAGVSGATLSAAVSSQDWSRGATSTSAVTLVEYTDFECPACAAYYPVIKQLEADYAGRLSLVVRHFPLAQHKNARPAAYAAEAAGKQGKFWEMYDILFARQSDWSKESDAKPLFLAYAQSLGLDAARFAADAADPAAVARIEADISSGRASSVQGTPSFYVNGTKIVNPNSYDEFKKIIDDALLAAR